MLIPNPYKRQAKEIRGQWSGLGQFDILLIEVTIAESEDYGQVTRSQRQQIKLWIAVEN
jgi:hypothetical protein